MKILMASIVTAVAVSGSISTPAFAGKEKCHASISIQNNSNRDVKVTDIKYYDSTIRDWRNESGVKGRVALMGESTNYTRALEEVRGDSGVKIKVKYKKNVAGKWKDATWSGESSAVTCNGTKKSRSNYLVKIS